MKLLLYCCRIAKIAKLLFHQEVFVESYPAQNFVPFFATGASKNTNAKEDRIERYLSNSF